LDPLDGDAAGRVDAWMARAVEIRPSRLETVRLTSTDPDDLTLRAARLLGEADHVFHRADVPAAILARARADAVRHVAEAPPVDPPAGLSLWLSL
ncbi:MAG: siroheme synthase, partial [Sphingopyxis sp.]